MPRSRIISTRRCPTLSHWSLRRSCALNPQAKLALSVAVGFPALLALARRRLDGQVAFPGVPEWVYQAATVRLAGERVARAEAAASRNLLAAPTIARTAGCPTGRACYRPPTFQASARAWRNW